MLARSSTLVPESRRFPFDSLPSADLVVDATYEGGTRGNAGDDPLHQLLRCGIGGGFRARSRLKGTGYQFVALYSDLSDNDWPDVLDSELGRFTYYGDNKRPGSELHQTKRGGNRLLAGAFGQLHSGPRAEIPPFLIFTKGLKGRDVVFRGVAVPGAPALPPTEDLVAVWRSNAGQRFQNYRAVFTVLDIPKVSRAWIDELLLDVVSGPSAPEAWLKFHQRGVYRPLTALRTKHRLRAEQLPVANDRQMIRAIIDHFPNPYDFERCASLIWELHASRVQYEATRPTRDGGRDAFGGYFIGPESDPIRVEFVLEAKRYDMRNAVGVKELARLISRTRNRIFGVLVTTSFLHEQAYQELKADGHPIIVIAARDIVDILRSKGIGDVQAVRSWLAREFPTVEEESMMAPPCEFAPSSEAR